MLGVVELKLNVACVCGVRRMAGNQLLESTVELIVSSSSLSSFLTRHRRLFDSLRYLLTKFICVFVSFIPFLCVYVDVWIYICERKNKKG